MNPLPAKTITKPLPVAAPVRAFAVYSPVPSAFYFAQSGRVLRKKNGGKNETRFAGLCRMKLRHTILKRGYKPCPGNCTTKRGSNQMTDQEISPRECGGSAHRDVLGWCLDPQNTGHN